MKAHDTEAKQEVHVRAERALAFASAHFEQTIRRLSNYLRVPAISCDSEHVADIERLAQQIAADLKSGLGFASQVLRLDGALPLVVAERKSRANPDAPTLLIYGHLDLQPVKGETWSSPPHEATVKGERLYARGAADDMGGWVSHFAACEAWLDAQQDLPLNVKWVIESEEEIGSPNLERYMDTYPWAFDADVMVLTDCENPSVEIPGLTVSLRGLYEVDVCCRALTSDVHSGLWGNVAPDAGNALIKLLGRLLDDDGRMTLGRQAPPHAWRAEASNVPLSPDVIHSGAHLRPAVKPLPLHDKPAAEWMWRQPAVTVLSTTFPRPDQHKNALRHEVRAALSIRLAPGQTRADMRALLEAALLTDAPAGVEVELLERPGGAESWLYDPQGPAFAAADRAYEKAWGRPLLKVGIGGSIPFVALFGRRYAHLPLILNGVMDPETGAHGPDESLSLAVFRKAIAANIHLLLELSLLQLAKPTGDPR